MKEENLIFIISLPRSGSTFLQRILSNNEHVNTCSEPWLLLNYANQIKPSLITGTFDNDLAIDAFKNYQEKYPDINFKEIHKKFLLSLYAPLLGDHKLVIDKTPRYWEMMDEIRELFPESKIIILKRNPIEVAKSIFKTWNVDSIEKILPYYNDLIIGPSSIDSFERKNSNDSQTYFLTYEELLQNTELVVGKLYKWLDIPFDKTVLEAENNDKFKGKYGDPFLNSTVGYKKARDTARMKELNNQQELFLKGYANFLGKDFLIKYGDFRLEHIEFENTLAFKHFIHLRNHGFEQFNFLEKFKILLKEQMYRLIEKF